MEKGMIETGRRVINNGKSINENNTYKEKKMINKKYVLKEKRRSA